MKWRANVLLNAKEAREGLILLPTSGGDCWQILMGRWLDEICQPLGAIPSRTGRGAVSPVFAPAGRRVWKKTSVHARTGMGVSNRIET